MSFAGNTLLEKLYVANLTVYSEGLDLSTCSSLVEVDATGSSFTEVAIADGAPIEKITLEAPTALTLSNLTELKELNINNKSKLTTLLLNNIDESLVNSRTIVNDVLTALKNVGSTQPLQYKLTRVEWQLNAPGDVESEKVKILETLLDTTKAIPIYADNKIDRISYSEALTGTLDITANAYDGANALKIYNTYATKDKFGNLEMEFGTSKSTLYTVYIYDGNRNVFWKKKAAPGTVIDTAFLSSGPSGAFDVTTIYKTATDQYEYEFLNKWEVLDDEGTAMPDINTANPVGITINKNIHLYPKFKNTIRSYTITVKSKHPVTGAIATWRNDTHLYGTPLKDIIPLNAVPHFDSDAMNLTKYAAYDCKGYSLSENSSILVSDAYTVKNTETLWAVMVLEDDIRNVVHPEWFEGTVGEYDAEETTFGIQRGAIIKPKTVDGKPFILPDKITLPASFVIGGTTYPVIGVEGFGGTDKAPSVQTDLKYVFMDKNNTNKLYDIRQNAFAYMPNLKYFDFDNCNVRYIRSGAFRKDSNLTNTTFSPTLWRVGANAFNEAITSTEATTIIIPSSVKIVGQYGFAHLNIAPKSTLTIGYGEAPNLLSQLELIGSSTSTDAFRMNSANKYSAVIFYSATYGPEDISNIDDWFVHCFAEGVDVTKGALTIY